MNIYVIRNRQQFGPYSEQTLLDYVNSGTLLKQDIAFVEGQTTQRTVGYFLKRAHLKASVPHRGHLFSQLKAIGAELIFPFKSILQKDFWKDRQMLILLVAGLLPMLLMLFPLRGYFLFYTIALYFSIIWGMFFYACFKTQQVHLGQTVGVFFFTQVVAFVIWGFCLNKLNVFYNFTTWPFPLNVGGYILGVGLTEEFAKMVPLLFLLSKAKEPLIPQTIMFYGLMSGIAFGVYEGVEYQMTLNAAMEYDQSFFLNIARLTSLPFMHACWCGIGGYFLSFANLYPKYRRSLYTLALLIPSCLHGLYDSFCGVWQGLSIVVAVLTLLFLSTYLKQGVDMQSKLRQ